MNSPGQNTRVGSHSLLQGRSYPNQGSNSDLPKPGLLHCRWILLLVSHQGSPFLLQTLPDLVAAISGFGSRLYWASPSHCILIAHSQFHQSVLPKRLHSWFYAPHLNSFILTDVTSKQIKSKFSSSPKLFYYLA